MSNYQELLKQREELEARIREARQLELKEAVAKVRELVDQFSLTENDVFGVTKTPAAKVAPKYLNPETGDTWTGRGKPPKWIIDKNRDDFLITK